MTNMEIFSDEAWKHGKNTRITDTNGTHATQLYDDTDIRKTKWTMLGTTMMCDGVGDLAVWYVHKWY